MNDADFERRAQRAAAWMRTQAEQVAEPEAALTQLFADEAGVDGPAQTRTVRTGRWRHRRRWAALASAAAVVALIIGVAVTGREQAQAPVLTSPTTTEPVPTTTFTSPTSAAPATTTSTPPTTQPPPTVVEGVVTVGQLRDLLDGPYEGSGIERVCGSEGRCTQVRFDPLGAPISFDPTSGVITRHVRGGASFTLPAFDDFTRLVAGGPGEVVYVLQSSGTVESNDLVAYSLAVGDAGREIARFPTSYGVGDGELIPSPSGLVMSPSTAAGLQPADIDNVAVAWVDRNGNITTSPTPLVRVDFAGITVDVNGRSWTFDDPVDGAAPSLQNFSPTFDGGVIGVVQHSTDGRTGVVRGWSDGSVDTWVLPPEIVRADLEPSPTGHVLVPSPGTFMTAEVFALRDDDFWTGRREFDFDNWTVTYPGLDDYLDTNNPRWEQDPTGFAHALAGRTDSPAETRTIEVINSDTEGAEIQVTTEGFLDDSGFGSRLVVRLRATDQAYRVEQVERTQACQPGRGHQDYQPAPCA
jgi:hypothetical protein